MHLCSIYVLRASTEVWKRFGLQLVIVWPWLWMKKQNKTQLLFGVCSECIHPPQAIWIKRGKAAFSPTLAWHPRRGCSTVTDYCCCVLTGAFSCKCIISFHAASSLMQNHLTDMMPFPSRKMKDLHKNIYKDYPWISVFCAAVNVQHADCMLTHLRTNEKKKKKKLCQHNIYHSKPNILKAGEPKLLLLGCGWMCISSTALLPFKAILRLLSLCPAKIKHTHTCTHECIHTHTCVCTHTQRGGGSSSAVG